MTSTILVIEDDPDTALSLTLVLRSGGFEVARAGDGRAGLREFHELRPSLVLLDIGLPVLDGWQVLERIRDMSDTPVLMVTADTDEAAKVRGLRSGADDYLAKPFGNAELLARIQALLRRSRPGPAEGAAPAGGAGGVQGAAAEPSGQPGAAEAAPPASYDDGFLRVDYGSCDVTVNGAATGLTPTEFRLLAALIRRSGQVLSPAQLLELAWNDPGRVGPDRVKFSVMRLRRKLGAGSRECSPIEAVRGFGYRYVPPAR